MVRRLSAKEARVQFAVLDRIRAKNRNKDPEEVQSDIAAAVAEVRAASQAKGRKRA